MIIKREVLPELSVSGFSYHLKDGTPIGIRAIRKEDKELLKHGFDMLSEHSRYLRFCGHVQSLSDAELTYLSDVDQVNHVAWGAFDLTGQLDAGIGIGRYIRIGDSDRAELAVTVVDSYQNRGLGKILLGILYLLARKQGINRFCIFLYAENGSLLRKLFPLSRETAFEMGMFRAEIPVLPDLQMLKEIHVDSRFLKLLEDLQERLFPQGQQTPKRIG